MQTHMCVPISGFLNMLLAFWAEQFFVLDEAVLCIIASLAESLVFTGTH